MLKKLSIRNARRQVDQYLLYFSSMIVSVALIYGFNTLIFSDATNEFATIISSSNKTELRYMIGIFSVIVVLIFGWFISYMMNFMLKKRSKELSIYMVLGIEKKQIIKMLVLENLFIGVVALAIGWIVGIFIAEIIETFVVSIFGGERKVTLGFSFETALITLIYFLAIFFFALANCNRKLKKTRLVELLYYKDKNEELRIKNIKMGMAVIAVAIGSGIFSLHFFSLPTGNVMDIFAGLFTAIVCQVCFFTGLPSIIYIMLKKRKKWTYKKDHLFLFRILFSTINHMSFLLGCVAALFTVAIMCIGISISLRYTMAKTVELDAFDISILHPKENYDFEHYSKFISENISIESDYEYAVYTNYENSMMQIRNKTLSHYFRSIQKKLAPEDYVFNENRYDMYMKYSDYKKLRDMLGLETVTMENNQYIIHCMPYLQDEYNKFVTEKKQIDIMDKRLSCEGVYTEIFSQYKGYGNGQECIVVVPDKVADSLDIVYSIYVANSDSPVPKSLFDSLTANFETVEIIDLNKMTFADTGYATLLVHPNKDYIGGKFAKQLGSQNLVLIIPLFYMALIVTIIGSVILAVQIMSESEKNIRHYRIIKMLGMSKRNLVIALRKQCMVYFVFPAALASLLGGMAVLGGAQTLCIGTFDVPVIDSIQRTIMQVSLSTVILFLMIYCTYGFIAYIYLKKDILKSI